MLDLTIQNHKLEFALEKIVLGSEVDKFPKF